MEKQPGKTRAVKRYRRSALYSAVLVVFRAIFHGIFRGRAQGGCHVPAEGPVILICNHTHAMDPLTLAACTPRRQVHFMAKKELFQNRLLAWLLRALHAFPVGRGRSDLAAMREAMSVLRAGNALGIFPEGHRGDGVSLGEIHSGAGLLALRSAAPVVPVFVRGSYRLFRGPSVAVGAPVEIEDLRRRGADKESVEEFSHRLRAALNRLSAQFDQKVG